MATIVKRGSTFQAKIRRHGFPLQTASFDTRAEAEAWARMIESEMDRGVFVNRSLADQTLFADVLKRYRDEVTPQKAGAKNENYKITALLRDKISHYSLAALSPKVIAEYRDRRLLSVSPSTVNRELNLIGAVCTAAIKDYGIPMVVNPVSMIRRPKNPPGQVRRISPEEEQALLEAFEPVERDQNGRFLPGPRNPWMKPFFILALETGARRSDLLRLQWDQVDLVRRIAVLNTSKNGRGRILPLSSKAAEVMLSLPRLDNRVFPVTADSIKKAWERAKRRAKVSVRFHDTRHEATSRLFEKGLNIMEVASITGHRDLRMLHRYTHVDAERLAAKLG